jgi:hypothetical protein
MSKAASVGGLFQFTEPSRGGEGSRITEHGPACGLGKGEAGTVPGHGPARLTWPRRTRTAFSGFVPCFLGTLAILMKTEPRRPALSEAMAIYKLIQNTAFEPKDIERLVTAYEQTLRALRLTDRSDPITHLVAEKIIAIGRLGIEDPAEISKLALKELTTR